MADHHARASGPESHIMAAPRGFKPFEAALGAYFQAFKPSQTVLDAHFQGV
jgi:hypothetical protein